MLLPLLFFGLVGMVAFTMADDDGPQDLGTVLANHPDLTVYYQLIKKFPDILLQLPNYSGVTIVAPSDDAFENIPYTALDHIWDPENANITVPLLQYMILQGTVSTEAVESGPTYVKSTLLTNPDYTNVTSGQNILVVKQPEEEVVFTTSLGTRCTVVSKDIRFQGGLIQVVDNLLIPPARLRETLEAFKLTSFLGGLYESGIMPELADRKNVTIFAPKNSALQAIGTGLKDMDAEQLARVMGYHVIPNEVLVSSELKNGTWLKTLTNDASGNPQQFLFRQIGNNMFINSAQIVQPDILLANGIMHLISGVVNPDVVNAPDPKALTQAPVFAGSKVTNVPFTSAIPCTKNCPVTTTFAPNSTTVETSTTSTSTTSFTTRSSQARAAAVPTGHLAGVALGMMGVGAGMALL